MSRLDTARYSELDYEIVEVGTMCQAQGAGHVLSTHTLGSSLGMSVFDPELNLGCLLHAPLPLASIDPGLAESHPSLFVDTGMLALFDAFFAAGGRRHRMQVKVAGCAVPPAVERRFWVGERNMRVAASIAEKNGIKIESHAVGGLQSRRMRLHLETGGVVLSNGASEWPL